MIDALKLILDFIKDNLPSILIGFKLGKFGKEKIEAELAESVLKLKVQQNHEKIDRDSTNIRDVDSVNKIAGPK